MRTDSRLADWQRWVLLFLAGAATTLSFQPFGWTFIMPVTFVFLFSSLVDVRPASAAVRAWSFSMGLLCTGVSWIFWSLHFHGGAPAVMAALMIIMLAAYLSLYPAAAAFTVTRLFGPSSVRLKLLLLLPVAFGIAEWLQGYIMTGFAWMQPGYVLIDTPLAGFAPVFGNHGLGVVFLICVGALTCLLRNRMEWKRPTALIIVLFALGSLLQQIEWTEPSDEPIRVSLLQGNIPQHLKWKPESRGPTLRLYHQMSIDQEGSDLIIWPETAVPGYLHTMGRYLDELKADMDAQGSDVLLGIFIRDDERGYFNSLYDLDGSDYRKRHLVPLGEYIPLRSLIGFFNQWVKIPMSDIAHGDDGQPLLEAAGQRLGVSICFEDAFARDVLKDLPEASLLVNVSNDAWFDGSHENAQHHTIARMRSLETGRPMLRVTNTGITSFIGPDGRVISSLPAGVTAVLTEDIQPMRGSTPYIFWGDACVILFGLFVLAYCWRRQQRKITARGA